MKAVQFVSLAIALVALSTAASAQRGMRGGGHYNAATEITLTGLVESVTTAVSPGRGGGGLHLTLGTSSGQSEVRVGPASFVSSRHVTFSKGDALTVIGSKITVGDREVILAREIRKGEQVLTLRDTRGVPLWALRRGTQ